jgi:3-isopropylmalate/(R)-2-methylmalate dehydratase small subunit
MTFQWIYEGRAWVFGDNIGVDGDLMPLSFALSREIDPNVLRRHLFSGIDPDFPNKCNPGDIIVAGKRFAHGNPHIQGLLGIRGAGLGLVVESIPSGSLRNAVNAGLAMLPSCVDVRHHVADGDRLKVDFRTGNLINFRTGWTGQFQPLSETLRTIIENGGWRENFRRRLANG